MVDPQDQGAPPKRFCHGRQVGAAVRSAGLGKVNVRSNCGHSRSRSVNPVLLWHLFDTGNRFHKIAYAPGVNSVYPAVNSLFLTMFTAVLNDIGVGYIGNLL